MDRQEQIQIKNQDAEKTGQGALLPLDVAERVVSWRVKESEKIRTHVFRRISADDWQRYFSGISFEFSNAARMNDFRTPLIELYDRCAIRAEGYSVRGGADLDKLPNWKRLIPPGHKIQAVNWLTKVEDHAGDDVPELDPELCVAVLDAAWNGEAPGQMSWHRGLVHRFNPPTSDQLRRYNRQSSRAVIVGGAHDGRTVYHAPEPMLVKLYDELIVSVEGYSFDGGSLDRKEQIVAEMDAFHKASAAARLFAAGGEEEKETEPVE
jgi:hypothetical protein